MTEIQVLSLPRFNLQKTNGETLSTLPMATKFANGGVKI